MKRIVLFLVLIAGISFSAEAQGEYGFGVHASWGANWITSFESYERFRASYNEVAAQNSVLAIDKELDKLGRGYARTFFFYSRLYSAMYTELTFGLCRNSTEMTFANNQARKIEHQRFDLDFLTGVGIPFGDEDDQMFGTVAIGIGMVASSANFRISYRYSDGHYSFGEERSINGIYLAHTLKPQIGIRALVPVLPTVSIFSKFSVMGTIFKKDDTFFYADHGKGTDLSPHSGTTTIPEDYSKYYNGQSTVDDPKVYANFSGISLQIGIALSIQG
ncbi:MAG: hypothetical protein KDC92_02880 [Bacteroidetes bacterium]|nr:hypothetical protein [Bacteroidota bacterium]